MSIQSLAISVTLKLQETQLSNFSKTFAKGTEASYAQATNKEAGMNGLLVHFLDLEWVLRLLGLLWAARLLGSMDHYSLDFE